MLRLVTSLFILLSLWPLHARAQEYVGSERCIACHQAVAEAWQHSHHAAAWAPASPETIRANFDGTSFELGDMSVRFRRQPDGSYHAEVTEQDGVTTDYPVQSVVGIEPLQQYLFETEAGRLQSFDVVWDTDQRRWFHLYPDLNPPPSDALHWTGPYKTWNSRCAVCHATGYQAAYDPASRQYSSRQAEIGVGCEACHGPAQAHLDWAADPDSAQRLPDDLGFAADLSEPSQFLDTCGGCHSRRGAFQDSTPAPGTPFHDAYELSLLRPGLYWPDGQIRDEVYVLGSFLQSKMQSKGVTCSNCHDPHSGARIAEGNALCSQCHSPAGNPDFPSLPLQVFDGPEHHRHSEASPGAQCTACHMAEQVYMGNDWRADHSFRIPRPDLSAATGAPDACTSCHQDREPTWAAAVLEEWFPESPHRGPHFGQILARAQTNLAATAPDLSILARSEAPGIVRATALWLLGQSGAETDQVATLLRDPDPLVRAAAVEAQSDADPQIRVTRIVPLLEDPSRNVRIAAAKTLLGAPIARLPESIAEDLQRAQSEWRASMASRLDFPETHLQLGGMALTLRNFPAAAQAFAEVTTLDPQHVDAWVMRARLAAALQGATAAEDILTEALAANPADLALASMLAELTGHSPDLTPP